MHISNRLRELERRFGAVRGGDDVVFFTLFGRHAPESCKAQLLADDKKANHRALIRFIRVFGDDHMCRACGDAHEKGNADVDL